MKRAALSSVMMALCLLTISQVPESFNYQVVVRDGTSNNPLTNQDVSFKMSILKGSSSGESQYSELHSANTGALGIVNLVIGNGTGKTGNISTISWGADTYFLKVEIDKTGGSSYVEMGTTQLLSVPYALYANEAKTSSDAVKYISGTQTVIGNNSPIINTGTRNVFIGKSSGMNNTTGAYNTFIGSEAGLSNTFGNNNIAIGQNALRENDEGYGNIAIGLYALEKNKIGGGGAGSLNVAIGYEALRNVVSNDNVAVGAQSLLSLSSGTANAAFGNHTLRYLTTGSSNTALGAAAMMHATGGNDNIAIGRDAGNEIVGSQNLFIGNSSGYTNHGSSNIFIGFLSGYGAAWQDVSNRLIIHNGYNGSDIPLIYGEFDNAQVIINGSFKATNGIDATNKAITNVADPIGNQDAVTKAYVDILEQNIEYLIDLLNDYGITASVTDIDGNEYRTVKIGTMVWMLENLKTTKYNDDTVIPYVEDDGEWNSLTTPGYCWFDDNQTAYGNTYGALYNWYAVQTGNLCPVGWRVPILHDWESLIDICGGEPYAGAQLKESGTDHWNSPNYADNNSGFTALPGGHRKFNSVFDYLGYRGFWWSSSQYNSTNGYVMYLINDSEYGSIGNYNYKGGFSVRCIKD